MGDRNCLGSVRFYRLWFNIAGARTRVHVGRAIPQQPEEKPTQIVLTPADAGDMLVDITWDSWTQQQATGKAVRATKDCVPDCATGGTTRRDVTLTFQDSKALPDDAGWWQFTKLVITGSAGKSETIDMPMTAQ
ncbi:Uncharacterised protein [Mycobacteroides abscessus subsp. massiliense]|nr:Uncharacterised protein [Mycobacteroides abscessus subsp. massiliense]